MSAAEILFGMLVGEMLDGKYLLEKLLGAGNYGGVYRSLLIVRDTPMGKPVAVKVLLDNASEQLTELKEGMNLEHPHLLKISTVGEWHYQNEKLNRKFLYLVMELGEGTLANCMCGNQLTDAEVRTIVKEIASGVDYLHGKGKVHRDLKPANIIRVQGKNKIGDYGLVRSIGQQTQQTSNSPGTIAYMPPEAIGGTISTKWDMWSLGIMIVQMLKGQILYVLNGTITIPKLGGEWDGIVAGCLQMDYTKRWSAQQVLDALNPPPPPPPHSYTFTVVKLDERGKEVQRYTKSAELYTENLGNGIILEMAKIPPGAGISFTHMGIYPVTQGQYEAIMGTNPSHFKKGNDFPVESVSWDDARKFCDILSRKTGKTYRLPLEKEWEYACRAGTTTEFHFGPTITTDVVNYGGDYPYGNAPRGEYRKETTKVGSFGVANDFGLYDMHGNVWEWCGDNNYESDTQYRPLRGGSWGSNANGCRCDSRNYNAPGYRSSNCGFRVVL